MSTSEDTRDSARATPTRWAERNPARFQYAHGLLMMGQPREQVIEQVRCAELNEHEAAELVAEAWETGRPERQREGKSDMRLGWSLVGSGVLGLLSTAAAPHFLRGYFGSAALTALITGLGTLWRGSREASS